MTEVVLTEGGRRMLDTLRRWAAECGVRWEGEGRLYGEDWRVCAVLLWLHRAGYVVDVSV